MQGKSINGFILQRLLGTGGMAEVWYAENEIGMKAAVKILSEELSHNAQMQERFLNEAKVMVRLDHPNIRKVYGYGSIDNRPAIIMEFLDGSDLKARMKRGQCFTDEELQRWWNQMVDALNYTHAYNIVHRDIKPSNIFIDQKGDAKLLDFGIAKVTDTTTGTLTGSTLGTRIYMSPEQVKDPKRVGTASDVYSLAVSFVHLLTGKAPYDSTTSSDYEIQVSIVTKPVDMSKVPAEWQSFLMPYLNKEADRRPMLRPFEVVQPEKKAVENTDEDDSTVVDEVKQLEAKHVQQQKQNEVKEPILEVKDRPKSKKELLNGDRERSQSKLSKQGDTSKPKKKVLPWLIGLVAAAVVLLVLWLPRYSDSKEFESCMTVEDYRNYVSHHPNGRHKEDALSYIENHVNDSITQAEALRIEEEERAKRKCFEDAINLGKQKLGAKEYEEAKKAFASAKNCPYYENAVVDSWLAKCDTAKLEDLVCGEHLLSLQWISWDRFGRVKIEKESSGRYRCIGEQSLKNDYLKLDGYITIVSEKHLKYEGTIKSRVSFLNKGKEYCRKGTFDFKATSGRKYWREQKMNGPDGCTDYVDIYFEKWKD